MYDKNFISRPNIDNKLLLIMAFLRIRASGKGIIGTTIENIVENIGYIPNRREGKINDTVIKLLKWLEENNYIFISTDVSKISQKAYFEIEINSDNNIFNMLFTGDGDNKDTKLKPYVLLTDKEFKKIVKTNTKVNKGILLRVFLNIKKRISFDDKAIKICYPSLSLIAKDCGIPKGGTVYNSIKELINIGLLFEYDVGKCKTKDGKLLNVNKVYSLEELDADGIKYAEKEILNYLNKNGINVDLLIHTA